MYDYIQCSRCGKYNNGVDGIWTGMPIPPVDANSIGYMACPPCKRRLMLVDANLRYSIAQNLKVNSGLQERSTAVEQKAAPLPQGKLDASRK